MKKTLLFIVFVITFLSNSIFVNAAVISKNSQDTNFDKAFYIEHYIYGNSAEDSNVQTQSTTKTITKTKKSVAKNSSGDILWSVTIKATFSYDGETSKCTSYSHSTSSPGKSWSIKSSSYSKSGNSATVKATAIHKGTDGTEKSYSRSVTIKCSPSGVIS
ncbi:MAG: hypothetical protein LUF92_00580 [Clostridiales bacterium]|nr:hypothetical protein [Clostridiales bacterium]